MFRGIITVDLDRDSKEDTVYLIRNYGIILTSTMHVANGARTTRVDLVACTELIHSVREQKRERNSQSTKVSETHKHVRTISHVQV